MPSTLEFLAMASPLELLLQSSWVLTLQTWALCHRRRDLSMKFSGYRLHGPLAPSPFQDLRLRLLHSSARPAQQAPASAAAASPLYPSRPNLPTRSPSTPDSSPVQRSSSASSSSRPGSPPSPPSSYPSSVCPGSFWGSPRAPTRSARARETESLSNLHRVSRTASLDQPRTVSS